MSKEFKKHMDLVTTDLGIGVAFVFTVSMGLIVFAHISARLIEWALA